MERVNKTRAEKLFKGGETILFIPCKLNPTSPWSIGVEVNTNSTDCSFNELCNAITYYNCNAETGKYLAYYVK